MWFGVSAKRKFEETYGYYEETFYGVANDVINDSWYLNGKHITVGNIGENNEKIKDKIKKNFFMANNMEIDIYLDVDEGILKMTKTGDVEPDFDAQIDGINNGGNKNGWIPHIAVQNRFQNIRIAKINPSWYGIKKDIKWT